MSNTTKIQWCDATFNPWIGCTKVSPGCKNCYAEKTTRARVLRGQGQETWGKGAQRSRTSAATWKKPLAWETKKWIHDCGVEYMPCECGGSRRRSRIFPSLCDWLDDEVPIEWLADFLKLIHDTPNLNWLLLTKRPENFETLLDKVLLMPCSETYYNWLHSLRWHGVDNIWPGTSVENQPMADKRIIELLKIPAKIRFLSVEPMLEAIKFRLPWFSIPIGDGPEKTEGIDWVIFGGESGDNARPCNMYWIRDGERQCKAAGIPAFVKQLGKFPFCDNANDFEWPDDAQLEAAGVGFAACRPVFKDKKGGDMSEWPEELRVRQFPILI